MAKGERQVKELRDAVLRRKPAIAAVLGLLLVLSFFTPYPINVWEEAMMRIDPSAGRAYAYATRHFDARNPSVLYDIDRAEKLYREAVALDPAHALAYHQLARIAFLRGESYKALGLIEEAIALQGDDVIVPSYYVRALILAGYFSRYDEAAADYARVLAERPTSWAALNDYAWVLLKAERFEKAAEVAEHALTIWPQNPWLLNTSGIAKFETGDMDGALRDAERAAQAVEKLTVEEWLRAYPGNDPRSAEVGIQTLKDFIAQNIHTILVAQGGGGL